MIRVQQKKYVIFILLVSLISGCTDTDKRTSQKIATGKIVDSIALWLQEADSLQGATGQALQQKALRYAQNTKNNSARLRRLADISLYLYDHGDSSVFRKANAKTIAMASQLNDSNALANAQWDLAFFLEKNNKQDSAFYQYSQAQKIFTGLDKKELAGQLLLNMATIQQKEKDYTGSEATTVQAIELLDPLQQNRQLYRAYKNLATCAKYL